MLPETREPTSPGDMLKYFLTELEITQVRLAEYLEWTPTKVNELIKNKRGFTPETALGIGDALGNGAEFWLNVQRQWDLWHAAKKHKHRPPIAS